MLEVDNLSKQYPTARGMLPILSDVTFSLSRGQSASIVGPSGCGKSTLLYVLGAIEPPSGGRVTLDGQDPFELDEREIARFRNTRVGFVFQDHLLLPQCTVLENVLVPTLVGDPDPGAAERALQLIDQVGLAERAEHRPGELSGRRAPAGGAGAGVDPAAAAAAVRRADRQPRPRFGGDGGVAALRAAP